MIFSLPKVELHCHLDGVLDPEMARVIQYEHPEFPIDLEIFCKVYPLERGIQPFFNWFNHIAPIDKKIEYYCWIAEQHVQRLKAQNVRYAEWMLPAGKFGLRQGVQQALEHTLALRECVDAQENGQIQVEFNLCVGRNRPPEDFERLVPALLALYQAGLICGVSLAGPEIGYPVRPFESIFARLHEAGLGIEIHAGEWCGPESVWDALEHGYPDRIGHGVSLFRDPKLVDLFLERQIHIEMCPTSNWRTGSIERIEDHPVAQARALGLNFSLNSDDPGAFSCSMASEYALAAEIFGFGEDDFLQIYHNSLAARFQPRSGMVN
jgi:adenosine deaminase